MIDRGRAMQRKIWLLQFGQFAVMALLLFSAAGTLDWLAGWTFLALYSLITTAMSLRLAKVDPGLLQERVRFGSQDDQPRWDRAVLKILGVLILVWLLVPGLDRVRFEWSYVPRWVQAAGGVAVAGSLIGIYRVMRWNSYLAPTVYVQRKRGHALVSAGPYRLVRHPFYALLVTFFFGGSLLLGSWLGAVVSALITLLLAFRCIREERHLSQELEGYADYMQRVPHRLIPHVW